MVIFKVLLEFLDYQPSKVHASGMRGILFSSFASCEPLRMPRWNIWALRPNQRAPDAVALVTLVTFLEPY